VRQRRQPEDVLAAIATPTGYRPGASDVSIKRLLRVADDVIASKPGLRDEFNRAVAEDITVEEVLGRKNLEVLLTLGWRDTSL
jgi:hypothetical protein